VILLATYNTVMTPFMLAFTPWMFQDMFLRSIHLVIDFLFLTDVVVNFRFTYIDSYTEEEVFEPKKIAINYISSGRFFIDLLAGLPLDLIWEYAFDKADNSLSLLRLLKLARILRIGKLIGYLNARKDIKLTIKFI